MSVTTAGPQWEAALQSCRQVLRRVANTALDPALDRRLCDLGERKEFLSAGEHQELLALVAFTQQRTLEKLEAELALRRLQAVAPEAETAP
jgi:hypothetical protein